MKEYINEAKKRYGDSIYDLEQVDAFIEGAKWHAERSYSEEEVLQLLNKRSFDLKFKKDTRTEKEWFEQIKKK